MWKRFRPEMASREAEESENSSVSIGNYWMASPSMRGGIYRCLRALRGSFIVHVGLGARALSSGGVQPSRGVRLAVFSWAFAVFVRWAVLGFEYCACRAKYESIYSTSEI